MNDKTPSDTATSAGEVNQEAIIIARSDSMYRTTPRRQLQADREEHFDWQPVIRLAMLETKLGWIGLARSDQGIVGLSLPRLTNDLVLADMLVKFPEGELADLTEFCNLIEPLRLYAHGQPIQFQIPFDLSWNTPFQRKVLETITHIPYGETRSYAWVAEQIGQPRAYRAVGQALGINPIPIIIPCHRVIASNGSLGGFTGGLDIKKRLLQVERVL